MRGYSNSSNGVEITLLFLFMSSCLMAASAGDFFQVFDLTWGGHRANILNGENISSEGLICSLSSSPATPPAPSLLTTFLVDNTPIRVFNNEERIGVPFPNKQPMRLYSSLWNADQWATRGGLVKTDWSKAPLTAYYRNFNADACVSSRSSCAAMSANAARAAPSRAWQTQGLDPRHMRSQ